MIDININKQKIDYKKNNIIIINDILNINIANNIYKLISNNIFNKLWYLTIQNGNKKYIFPYKYKKNINNILNRLKKNKKKGIFTYYIYRTFTIPNNIYFNKVLSDLSSQNFINKIKEITGENINKINDLFISKYEKNCYLDIHEDKNKGKLAFVLNLTKNWNIDDGGILFFLNEDNCIQKSCTPRFNTFILFRINEKSKYFVSSINNFTTNSRYSITGWFT